MYSTVLNREAISLMCFQLILPNCIIYFACGISMFLNDSFSSLIFLNIEIYFDCCFIF